MFLIYSSGKGRIGEGRFYYMYFTLGTERHNFKGGMRTLIITIDPYIGLTSNQCLLAAIDVKNINLQIKNIKNMFFHFYKKHKKNIKTKSFVKTKDRNVLNVIM